MDMNRFLFRLARKVKRLFFPPPTVEELRLRKQQQDYDYLVKRGVDTQLGYVTLFGEPIIHIEKGARIVLEEGVVLISSSEYNWAGVNHPVVLSAYEGAEIILHKGVGLSGTSVVAVAHVEIGENTKLGANTNVYETDFHLLDPIQRPYQKGILDAPHGPVVIGSNCWLASNVSVLKNVTIGDNVVVGAMSLVNKDLPSNVLAGGVPAGIIKQI